MVELDIPKHRFRSNGTVTAVHHPPFTVSLSLACLLNPSASVVDLDCSPVDTAFVAHSPERTSIAVVGPVDGHFRPVTEFRYRISCATPLHVLPHRAYIIVLAGVVVHVPDEKGIVGIPASGLGLEHVILDIGVYPVGLHVRIVLFIAIAGVCHHLVALSAVSLSDGFQERYHRTSVRRPPVDAVVGYEPVPGGYLHVISRLGLAVVPRVLLHPHEGGIRVCPAAAVPLPHGLQMAVVRLQLRKLAIFLFGTSTIINIYHTNYGYPIYLQEDNRKILSIITSEEIKTRVTQMSIMLTFGSPSNELSIT